MEVHALKQIVGEFQDDVRVKGTFSSIEKVKEYLTKHNLTGTFEVDVSHIDDIDEQEENWSYEINL